QAHDAPAPSPSQCRAEGGNCARTALGSDASASESSSYWEWISAGLDLPRPREACLDRKAHVSERARQTLHQTLTSPFGSSLVGAFRHPFPGIRVHQTTGER